MRNIFPNYKHLFNRHILEQTLVYSTISFLLNVLSTLTPLKEPSVWNVNKNNVDNTSIYVLSPRQNDTCLAPHYKKRKDLPSVLLRPWFKKLPKLSVLRKSHFTFKVHCL